MELTKEEEVPKGKGGKEEKTDPKDAKDDKKKKGKKWPWYYLKIRISL